MTGGADGKNADKRTPSEVEQTHSQSEQRRSFVRELTPTSRIKLGDEITDECSGPDDWLEVDEQAATALNEASPSPDTNAENQFLLLESYKSLPRAARLPDLLDLEEEKTEVQNMGPVTAPSSSSSTKLRDWDDFEEPPPARTPTQLLMFDSRIRDYLSSCRSAAQNLLLKPKK